MTVTDLSDNWYHRTPRHALNTLTDFALWWRYALVAGVALVVAALFLREEFWVAGGLGFPLDDSWIHARIAQNLVRGQGFSFNSGVPTAGSTAPLWTLLLAAGHALTGEFVWAAKTLGCILFVLNAVVLGLLAEEVSGGRRSAGLLTGLALALCGPMVISALSGMETALYGLLAAAGFYCHVRWRDGPGWKTYLPAACFALTTMARPECGLLFIFSLADRFIARLRAGKPPGAAWREVVFQSLIFAALMLPYALFFLSISGRPYPHTFTAKSLEVPVPPLWHRLTDDLYTQFALLPQLGLGIALLLPIGLLALARQPRTGILFMTLFLYPLVRQLAAPVFTFSFQFQRYYIHTVEILALTAAVGLVALPDMAHRLEIIPALSERRRKTLLAGVGILFLLSFLPGLLEYGNLYARSVENINDMQVAIGGWLAQHTEPDDLIAVNDIGGIGVFSGREILDTVGLITPEVTTKVEEAIRAHPQDPQAKERGLLTYLIERQPDYLVVFPDWYPWLTSRTDLFQPYYFVSLTENVICGGDTMVVYRTAWGKPQEALP